MKGWNPFGKVDMEIGSFLKASPFNKDYIGNDIENNKEDNKEKDIKTKENNDINDLDFK